MKIILLLKKDRGKIYDRNGQLLSTNVKSYSLFVQGSNKIKDKINLFKKRYLKLLMLMNKKFLKKLISKKKKLFKKKYFS